MQGWVNTLGAIPPVSQYAESPPPNTEMTEQHKKGGIVLLFYKN